MATSQEISNMRASLEALAEDIKARADAVETKLGGISGAQGEALFHGVGASGLSTDYAVQTNPSIVYGTVEVDEQKSAQSSGIIYDRHNDVFHVWTGSSWGVSSTTVENAFDVGRLYYNQVTETLHFNHPTVGLYQLRANN